MVGADSTLRERRQIDAEEQEDETHVWNFAYGSNMCAKVLQGRRRIVPKESVPAMLDDWSLCFMRTIPYIEPGMGNAQPRQGSQLHGVLHKITRKQWVHLLETEGGGHGHRGQQMGYRVETVVATAYDGRKIEALILSETTPIPDGLQFLPSERYMTFLRDGAREHNLNKEYIKNVLDSQRTYQGSRVLRLLMAVMFVPAFLCIFATRIVAKKLGMDTYCFALAFKAIKRFGWLSHDYLLVHLFGNGADQSAHPPQNTRRNDIIAGALLVGAPVGLALGYMFWH